MSKANLLEMAEDIAGLMPRLARGLMSSDKDPADSLPLAQLRLCGILNSGPQAMSALTRELGVSHSALTQIADRLERANLVKRVAEESDRRVRSLQLTTRGEKMMCQRREARILRALSVLERLTAHEREAVCASLGILATACSTVQANQASANGRTDGNDPARTADTAAANGHANNHRQESAAGKRSKSKATLSSTLKSTQTP